MGRSTRIGPRRRQHRCVRKGRYRRAPTVRCARSSWLWTRLGLGPARSVRRCRPKVLWRNRPRQDWILSEPYRTRPVFPRFRMRRGASELRSLLNEALLPARATWVLAEIAGGLARHLDKGADPAIMPALRL